MLKKDLIDRVDYLEQQLACANESMSLLRESNEAANTSLRTRIAMKLSQFDGLSWAVPPGCSEEDLMAVVDRVHNDLQRRIDNANDDYVRRIDELKSNLDEYIEKYNQAMSSIDSINSKLNKYATYIADAIIDDEP